METMTTPELNQFNNIHSAGASCAGLEKGNEGTMPMTEETTPVEHYITLLTRCAAKRGPGNTLKPATAKEIQTMIGSTEIHVRQQAIRDRKERIEPQTLAAYKESIKDLKFQMPAITPNGISSNGLPTPALNDLMRANGFYHLDIDAKHMEADARELYCSYFKGKEKDYGIVAAFVSPSGYGLKIVFRVSDERVGGYDVEEEMRRVLTLVGWDYDNEDFEIDFAVKNPARLCYLAPSDMWLYTDFDLWSKPFDITPRWKEKTCRDRAVATDLAGAQPVKGKKYGKKLGGISEGDDLESMTPMPICDAEEGENSLECDDMIGAEFAIEELLSRYIAHHGAPEEGTRHTATTRLAFDLRKMGYSEEEMRALEKAEFCGGLPIAEVRAIVESTQSQTVDARALSVEMRQVVSLLRSEKDVFGIALPPMPRRMPRLLRPLLESFPANFHPLVLNAIFPAFVVYLKGTEALYPDGKSHEPRFISLLCSTSRMGKSTPISLIKTILKQQEEADSMNRALEEKYKQDIRTARQQGLPMPEKPSYPVQIVSPNMTEAGYVARLKEAQDDGGAGLLIYVDELDLLTISKGIKSDFWTTQMRLSFDTTEWGQERASAEAMSTKVRIRLNLYTTSTPGQTKRFFKNHYTNGTLNRLSLIVQKPLDFDAPMPRIKPISTETELAVHTMIEHLRKASGKGVVECKPLMKWVEKNDNHMKFHVRPSINDPLARAAFEFFGYSSQQLTFLKGAMLYFMNGCQWDKDFDALLTWFWYLDIYSKLQLFGREVGTEQIKERKCVGVRTSLFTQLPKTFSLEDVQKVYERNGKSRDKETILENIRNWKRGGKVREIEAKKLWTKIGVAI